MSFDARSKERLEALGRTLPQKLPPPQPPRSHSQERTDPSPRGQGRNGEGIGHPLEREEDPAELFRALMKASPDGSVPPHLLERLRELEAHLRPAATAEAPAAHSLRIGHKGQGAQNPRPGSKAQRGKATTAFASRAAARQGAEDPDLYTAFAQLLLEDDDELTPGP